MKKILVTGVAGFIGSAVAHALLAAGWEVVGVDSINNYYDQSLKFARLREAGISEERIAYGRETTSTRFDGYRFIRLSLEDRQGVAALFERERFGAVCHLAAQAGVRYSIENPFAYADSNLTGFLSILEGCRRTGVPRMVYASSSSVYGENTSVPFRETDSVDNPVSLYAATKKANELMAAAYVKLYGFSAIGLRFFTVYGPWGRPDMAPMIFLKSMHAGKPIQVFNNGNMKRDFTYIDDIVAGVTAVVSAGTEADAVPSRGVYNIGRGSPVDLMEFIRLLEESSGIKAEREFLPMQAGDVPVTWADTDALERDFGYRPATDLALGVSRFAAWYAAYYGHRK